MNKKMICVVLPMVLLASCATTQMDENQRFMRVVSKDVPFEMKHLQELPDGNYRFESFDATVRPDYLMKSDGELSGCNTTFDNAFPELAENMIWRNLYFNLRQHRIVCVDRFLVNGKRVGYVYPIQMESKKWPQKGNYHWDVTDRRNLWLIARSLESFKKQSIEVMSVPK